MVFFFAFLWYNTNIALQQLHGFKTALLSMSIFCYKNSIYMLSWVEKLVVNPVTSLQKKCRMLCIVACQLAHAFEMHRAVPGFKPGQVGEHMPVWHFATTAMARYCSGLLMPIVQGCTRPMPNFSS